MSIAKILWMMAGVAALTLAAVACGAAAQPDPGAADPQLPADFQVEVYRGQEALGGQEVAFSSLFEQEKPVVLNFWAGLCPPCRAEMPDLQAMSESYADDVMVLGLDIGPFMQLGTRDDGRALIEELNITYPTGSTTAREVVSAYRVLGMPTTVFLTPEGTVHRTWTGFMTEEKMTELVEELLAASAS